MKIMIFLLIFLLFFSAVSVKGLQMAGTFTPIPLSLTVDNPYPSNNSVNVALNVTATIDCASSSGYLMNISWYENTSGSWVLVQQNLNVVNGTYSYVFINSSNFSTTYWWKVEVNDGMGDFNNKTFCFTTRASSNIVISNVYPVNNSVSIPLQPVVYATFNHTYGLQMNISWYYGISSDNITMLIGVDNNILNSTQNELFYPVNSHVTAYWWKIVVKDSDGNWKNETFSFTTETVTSGRMLTNRYVFAIIGVIGIFGVIGVVLFYRRRNNYEY